jgi:hypothetical protein
MTVLPPVSRHDFKKFCSVSNCCAASSSITFARKVPENLGIEGSELDDFRECFVEVFPYTVSVILVSKNDSTSLPDAEVRGTDFRLTCRSLMLLDGICIFRDQNHTDKQQIITDCIHSWSILNPYPIRIRFAEVSSYVQFQFCIIHTNTYTVWHTKRL